MEQLKAISESLIKGQAPRVKELSEAAVAGGLSVHSILNDGLIAGMTVIGDRFERKEIYLPEVLLAARAMYAGLEVVEPLLLSARVEPVGKVAIGTVQGDLHDIGKNLVGIMLRGAGFEIVNLGADVPPEKFVAEVEKGVQIIGMSAQLTTSRPFMKATIEALEKTGLRDKVKTIVGGAIVSQGFADSIGADGYAPNATSAVDKAKQLLAALGGKDR